MTKIDTLRYAHNYIWTLSQTVRFLDMQDQLLVRSSPSLPGPTPHSAVNLPPMACIQPPPASAMMVTSSSAPPSTSGFHGNNGSFGYFVRQPPQAGHQSSSAVIVQPPMTSVPMTSDTYFDDLHLSEPYASGSGLASEQLFMTQPASQVTSGFDVKAMSSDDVKRLPEIPMTWLTNPSQIYV